MKSTTQARYNPKAKKVRVAKPRSIPMSRMIKKISQIRAKEIRKVLIIPKDNSRVLFILDVFRSRTNNTDNGA